MGCCRELLAHWVSSATTYKTQQQLEKTAFGVRGDVEHEWGKVTLVLCLVVAAAEGQYSSVARKDHHTHKGPLLRI